MNLLMRISKSSSGMTGRQRETSHPFWKSSSQLRCWLNLLKRSCQRRKSNRRERELLGEMPSWIVSLDRWNSETITLNLKSFNLNSFLIHTLFHIILSTFIGVSGWSARYSGSNEPLAFVGSSFGGTFGIELLLTDNLDIVSGFRIKLSLSLSVMRLASQVAQLNGVLFILDVVFEGLWFMTAFVGALIFKPIWVILLDVDTFKLSHDFGKALIQLLILLSAHLHVFSL